MDLGLTGKRAVVTGASKGIGLATARLLGAEGASVVAGARTAGPATEGVEWVEVDLARQGEPERLVAACEDVDVLINNVGAASVYASPLEPDDAAWMATLELNLLSVVRTCRAAIPGMIERGGGAVVNVSSVNGYLPAPDASDYSASKAAIVNFSKVLASTYAADGVRVNVISPGGTATPMWLGEGGIADSLAALAGMSHDAVVAQAKAEHPIGRLLEPEEIARAIVLLCSPLSSGVTGVDLAVDGGLTPTT
jgi:NAD(P)-dependent dehydrogenase (short-subunit alcohol dehydrogenase family)